MLQKESFTSAIPLADLQAQQGAVIGAKPNTVLGELVRLTNDSMLNQLVGTVSDNAEATQEIYNSYAESLECMTSGTIDQPTPHDKFMDGVVVDIAAAVTKHISFAKNIVKPVIIDYAEAVKARIDSMQPAMAGSDFNIIQQGLPELLADQGFVDTLKYYKDATPVRPETALNLNTETIENIHQMLLIGDREADEAITAWYSRMGDQFFLKIWEDFFMNSGRETAIAAPVMRFEDVTALPVFEKADVAMALYLLSLKLFTSIPDTKDVSLAQYTKIVSQIRDFAGSSLDEVCRKVGSYAATKILVTEINVKNQYCKVYKDNYLSWLEQGGSPETLFGLIISNKQIYSQGLIDAAKEELDQRWKTYSTFQNAAESNKGFNNFKDALRLQFRETMANLSDEEQAVAQSNSGYYETVNSRMEAEVEKLRVPDMLDLYGTALKLVCRARFYYTDAEKILTDIVEASVINPKIDVREAALLATINYLVDYIADQMTKVKG